MIGSSLASRLLVAAALALASGPLAAQSLPVDVTASGNQATVVVGSPSAPLADVTLAFEDATNLSPSSLGVSAELVSLTDPALLARLPDLSLIQLNGTFPLLLTIEPPALGGLRFRDSGRIEIHTHALTYSLGSSFRLFKAQVGGPFRDITDETIRWYHEDMDALGALRPSQEPRATEFIGAMIAMIEGLVARLKAEIGRPAKVLATGGLALLFDEQTDIFDAVDVDLTLKGLAILAEKASKPAR